MSANVGKLIYSGTEYPVHQVELSHDHRGFHVLAKATLPREYVETTPAPFARAPDPREKRDLIDFAKTGAPPAPKDCVELCDDCTCELAHKWVNQSPTYSAVLSARDVRTPVGRKPSWDRAVPRMTEQAEWKPSPCPTLCPVPCECDPRERRPESLNDFAREVHAANQHWWHDPATGEKLDRNMGEMLMLVVSEIAEAMEGERKDLMDDHLPHRKMAEVELADAIIRIADIVGARIPNFHAHVEHAIELESTLPTNKGEALFYIIANLKPQRIYTGWVFGQKLAATFCRIEAYADKHGYDLWGAVAEKREYNKHRADHKPEARLAAGGKKF